jgi:nucleoid-associated protein YgaU
MRERYIAVAPKAPIPCLSRAPASVLRRKCACGQRMGGARCDDCKKKNETLQRYPAHTSTVSSIPPIVYDVLRSPGQPLDADTRAFFEPRFGQDFSRVRVHADAKASESARAVNALAYTVGGDIVFAAGQSSPRTSAGRKLLAHELVHTVQQPTSLSSGAISSLEAGDVDSPQERDADRIAENLDAANSVRPTLASPQIQRKPCTGRVKEPVNFGEIGIEMTPSQAGDAREVVFITFDPDKNGPDTDAIEFIQIAKTGIPWGQKRPDQKEIDYFTTRPGDRMHTTHAGDTLESISIEHFGVPDKASEIRNANANVSGVALSFPLSQGIQLRIPEAVQSGFHVDISPTEGKGGPKKQPRYKPADQNISPTYPHIFNEGFKRPNGTQQAKMEDEPGSGTPDTFQFETAAHSRDRGFFYGAVQWGFSVVPSAKGSFGLDVYGAWCNVTPRVSDTLGVSIAMLNKFYMNKHVVQMGETLKLVSIQYYGDDSRSSSIYETNRGKLTSVDPDAQIPVGTELEMPGRTWERVKLLPEKETAWQRAKKDAKP